MNRRDLILAVLASADGRPFTPVQIQKAVFLISDNFPDLITDGPGFDFTPYDYGPFDQAVYRELAHLEATGDVQIAPSGVGRWNTYAATDNGMERAEDVFEEMNQRAYEYVKRTSKWVRSLGFTALVKAIYDAYPKMRENSIFKG
jgi:hypothetical protein